MKKASINLEFSKEIIKKDDWFFGTKNGIVGFYQAQSDEDGNAAWFFDCIKVETKIEDINSLRSKMIN